MIALYFAKSLHCDSGEKNRALSLTPEDGEWIRLKLWREWRPRIEERKRAAARTMGFAVQGDA